MSTRRRKLSAQAPPLQGSPGFDSLNIRLLNILILAYTYRHKAYNATIADGTEMSWE